MKFQNSLISYFSKFVLFSNRVYTFASHLQLSTIIATFRAVCYDERQCFMFQGCTIKCNILTPNVQNMRHMKDLNYAS